MEQIEKFLFSHWDKKSPLLLGYSGGPDSKALLYGLIEAGCKTLQVAHIDHGWREESRDEAIQLRKEVESLGIAFHSSRLEPGPLKNREAFAREARLAFFLSLFEKIPFQALFLAHQADDLAETCLKRLLEGAHLPFLGGMEAVCKFDKMPIWRPLLGLKKKQILEFLEKRNLEPLFDPTNRDPVYLRSRMREETVPLLTRSFGKEIVDNLICLSGRATELKNYLDRKIASRTIQKGEWGAAIYCEGLERIEARHLLQKAAVEEKIILPRTVLEPVLDWLEEKAPHRKIFFSSRWILVKGSWVFLLTSPMPQTEWIRSLAFSLGVNN